MRIRWSTLEILRQAQDDIVFCDGRFGFGGGFFWC